MENFSFKCPKIVKNASYLKNSARTVTHENRGGYFLLSNKSARKVLSACLENTNTTLFKIFTRYTTYTTLFSDGSSYVNKLGKT